MPFTLELLHVYHNPADGGYNTYYGRFRDIHFSLETDGDNGTFEFNSVHPSEFTSYLGQGNPKVELKDLEPFQVRGVLKAIGDVAYNQGCDFKQEETQEILALAEELIARFSISPYTIIREMATNIY